MVLDMPVVPELIPAPEQPKVAIAAPGHIDMSGTMPAIADAATAIAKTTA
jgi:hypothetical protein